MKLKLGPDGKVVGLDAATADPSAKATVAREQQDESTDVKIDTVRGMLVVLCQAEGLDPIEILATVLAIISKATDLNPDAVLHAVSAHLHNRNLPRAFCETALKLALTEAKAVQALYANVSGELRKRGL